MGNDASLVSVVCVQRAPGLSPARERTKVVTHDMAMKIVYSNPGEDGEQATLLKSIFLIPHPHTKKVWIVHHPPMI